MTKHYVVEGLDRVGKSSFIKALWLATAAQVVKMRVPKTLTDSKLFYAEHFVSLMNGEPTIWDRGHLSELVYAPLYRPTVTSASWTEALRRWIPRLVDNTTLIYVYPGDTALMKKDERPEADKLAEIRGFTKELEACPWPVYRVCSHEEVAGEWRWRAKDDMVAEILANVPLESYAGTRL